MIMEVKRQKIKFYSFNIDGDEEEKVEAKINKELKLGWKIKRFRQTHEKQEYFLTFLIVVFEKDPI